MDAASLANQRADAGPWAPALAAFAALTLVAAVLLHPTAARMAATWFESSSYSHGALVAPIAVWLAATDRRARALAPQPSLLGAPMALAAVLLWLLGRAAGAQIIEQIAFVSLLIAGVVAIFGPAVARIWAFPLGFLFFMVPFGESLIPALQQFTATTAVGFLSLAGAPAAIDGVLITTPAGVFEVGEACAGLRFLIAAVMAATLFAYLAFDGWRKRALFAGFAIALALCANALRAFLLIMLATLTEQKFGVGPEHLFVGWIFYGAIFLVLIAVGRRFADRPAHRAEPSRQPARRGVQRSLAAALAPLLAITLAASAYGRLVIAPRAVEAPSVLPLLSAPGWRILPPSDAWSPRFRGANQSARAAYQRPDAQVQAAIAYYAYERPGAEISAYGNPAFEGRRWRDAGARRASLFAFGADRRDVVVRFYEDRRDHRFAAITLYWFDEQIYASPVRLKFHQALARLKGAHAPGGVIVVAAPVHDDDIAAIGAIAAYLRDIDEFAVWRRRLDAGWAR